jgi:hypothetical protein
MAGTMSEFPSDTLTKTGAATPNPLALALAGTLAR